MRDIIVSVPLRISRLADLARKNECMQEEYEQALIDIAAVQAEQDEIQAQQEDALIELAALTEETAE